MTAPSPDEGLIGQLIQETSSSTTSHNAVGLRKETNVTAEGGSSTQNLEEIISIPKIASKPKGAPKKGTTKSSSVEKRKSSRLQQRREEAGTALFSTEHQSSRSLSVESATGKRRMQHLEEEEVSDSLTHMSSSLWPVTLAPVTPELTAEAEYSSASLSQTTSVEPVHQPTVEEYENLSTQYWTSRDVARQPKPSSQTKPSFSVEFGKSPTIFREFRDQLTPVIESASPSSKFTGSQRSKGSRLLSPPSAKSGLSYHSHNNEYHLPIERSQSSAASSSSTLANADQSLTLLNRDHQSDLLDTQSHFLSIGQSGQPQPTRAGSSDAKAKGGRPVEGFNLSMGQSKSSYPNERSSTFASPLSRRVAESKFLSAFAKQAPRGPPLHLDKTIDDRPVVANHDERAHHPTGNEINRMMQREAIIPTSATIAQTNLTLPAAAIRPSATTEQSSLQSMNNLFLHFEARFSQLTQQAEQTLRHAEERAARRIADQSARFQEQATRLLNQPAFGQTHVSSSFFQPSTREEQPTASATSPPAAPEERREDAFNDSEREREQAHLSMFGPQPFMCLDQVTSATDQDRTLFGIWTEVNTSEMLRHLKMLVSFDPLSQNPSIKDFLAWYSTVQPTLAQHANYSATYLLTRLVPPIYVERAIKRYHNTLPLLPLKTVVRLYGQYVYSLLKQNPMIVADHLRVGRDRITSKAELYQRVVDLFFCRSDRVLPIIFCYELVIAIGQHQEADQRALFIHNVIAKYPGLQQAAEAIKGTAMIVDEQQEQSLKDQKLPITAKECEQFASWILSIADVRPIPFRIEKRDTQHAKDSSRGPANKKAKTNLVNAAASPENASVQIQKVAAVIKQEDSATIIASTTDARAKPSSNALVTDPCKVHDRGFHNNDDCKVQHPELRSSPRESYDPYYRQRDQSNYRRSNDEERRPSSRNDQYYANRGGPRYPYRDEGRDSRYGRYEGRASAFRDDRRYANRSREDLRYSSREQEQGPPPVIPADFPPNAKCPIHRRFEHNWGVCRSNPRNPDNTLATGANTTPLSNVTTSASSSTTLVKALLTTDAGSQISSSMLCVPNNRIISNENKEVPIKRPEPSKEQENDEALNLSRIKDVCIKSLFTYTVIPFFSAEPLIHLLLNHVNTTALGDSGSGLSLVSVSACASFPTEMRIELQNHVLCLPFNVNEQDKPANERLTRLSEVLIFSVEFQCFKFLFPFFVFPGELDYPILGRDFLKHTSLSIHVTEGCFKFINEHKLPLYQFPFSKQVVHQLSITDAKDVKPIKRIMPQWRLPAGCIKCSVVNSYFLLPNEVEEILVQTTSRPFRPYVTYQVGIVPYQLRHQQFNLRTTQVYIESPSPPDVISVSIVALSPSELLEGEEFIWLLPLQQVLVNENSIVTHKLREYPLFSKFTPIPFDPQFPLPTSTEDYPVEDYTADDYRQAALEVATYVVKKEDHRYLQPRPGLLIEAGESNLDDSYLVLTAKALAVLPKGVWYQERPDSLPGIPEDDVVIPVTLTTTKPVHFKPRRLNPSLYAAVNEQMQLEQRLGLIEPSLSRYASPIVVVPKKTGKLRICSDYREVNQIAIPDRYPIPHIEDILALVAGSKYLSLLDLPMGFQQLHINPPDRHKLAFVTPMGHYQPIRLPYGFLNGPSAFQREYDVTLGAMRLWSRPYIDDFIGSDRNNHRRHDLKLQTVLFNLYRRGLAVHAEKSKILGTSVVLLGMKVDADGVRPYIKDGVFDRLKERKHSTLQHLQQTIGSLLWYRRFIPSFSFIIKPILDAARELTVTSSNNQYLNDICLPVIEQIEEKLKANILLVHPLPFSVKEIHIVAGNCAFATTLYQQPDQGMKQLLEHWSKVWPLNVRSYTIEERFALAVRETITRFRSLIQHSKSILIFTPCLTFTVLTHNESFWNPRVASMLFVATTLPIIFRTAPCPDLPILNDDLTVPLTYNKKGFSRHEIASFFQMPQSEVDNLPKIFTDGSCITAKGGQRLSGYGVFWGEESRHNLSNPCNFPPFTNNRAELEGILAAVIQAKEFFITKFIVYSDSQICVDKLNVLHAAQLTGVKADELLSISHSKTGLANKDLFEKILLNLENAQVSFQFIPRELNSSADALSRLYWSAQSTNINAKAKGEDEASELSSPIHSSESESECTTFEKQTCQLITLGSFEERDPFRNLLVSEVSSFSSQHFFQITERDPGLPPELGEFALLHDDRLQLPKVPVLDSSNYLNLISRLPALQKEDTDLMALRIALQTQNPSNLPAMISNFYPTAFIAIDSQLIWVRHKNVDKILVPAAAQLPLIELFHSSPQFGSHCGISPTLRLLRRLFIWTNMTAQVTSYCKNCQICNASKGVTTKTPGLLAPLPLVSKTFHRVHVDSIVGLPMTSAPGRYTYVLVIVDAFTKFLLAFPLTSIQAPQIIRCLNSMFTLFGAPLILVSDNGSEFKNKVVAEFLQTWGVNQKFTTSHNPQSNGQAEAMVKIIVQKLKTHLRHLASTRADAKYLKGSWAAALPSLVYSYNITPQKKLGVSPYEMLFGRLPPSLTKDILVESKLWEEASTNYCNRLKEMLSYHHSQAEYRLFKHRELMKKHFDLHRPTFTLEIGDFVYIGPPYAVLQKKLSPTFEGPFRVDYLQRNAETKEITGVCVNIGSLDQPLHRWYPRYRVRPVGSLNPTVHWESINLLK